MASMNVSLTPQLEQFVGKKVREGKYQTAARSSAKACACLLNATKNAR